jgi:hypothetical protein
MDKDNVVYVPNDVLFSHQEEWDYVICRKTDRTRDHSVEQHKPNTGKSQIPHVFSHMRNLDLYDDDDDDGTWA